jgi:parvulin-like peptidyl-prolyl isomerase
MVSGCRLIAGRDRAVRVLREPLLHFLIVGGLLFGGYAWWTRGIPAASLEGAVRIGEGEVRWLRETFASQWRRDPSVQEMSNLLTTLVNEELLAREARALGLDQNDTIVRRRLAQKLTFLVDDTSRIADPGDAALRRFQDEHATRYQAAPKATFSQIYFSPERRADAEGDAAAELTRISATSEERKTPAGGDPLLLETTYADLDQKAVEALFGTDFAHALFRLEPGRWTGPLKSAYGIHLLQLARIRPAEPRRFEDVRDAVLNDWRREREQETKGAYLARLRDKYGVVIEESAKALVDPKSAGAQTP